MLSRTSVPLTSLIQRHFNPSTAAVEAAAARRFEVATVYVPGINILVLGTKLWGTHSRLGTTVIDGDRAQISIYSRGAAVSYTHLTLPTKA